MRITENRLRKIIRRVLIEINTPQQAQAAMLRSAAPKNEDDFEKSFGEFYREKKKGINLRKGRDKTVQKRLISKFRKDLELEDVISPERTSQFSKSFGKEIKTEEEAIVTYDIDLFQEEKDESKPDSFIGPIIGKNSFIIRYEGNVFTVKIKHAYPEDRVRHANDIVKKLKSLGFSKITSNTSDL